MFSSDRFSFDTLRNSDATRKMEKQRALVTVAVYIAMAFAAKMCFVCYCFQFLIVTIAFYYRYKLTYTLHIYIVIYWILIVIFRFFFMKEKNLWLQAVDQIDTLLDSRGPDLSCRKHGRAELEGSNGCSTASCNTDGALCGTRGFWSAPLCVF